MIVSTPAVAIFRRDNGALLYVAPTGYAFDASQYASVALPAGYDDQTFVWNATTRSMGEDAAKIEASLIQLIDEARETMQMTSLTAGGAKKYVYNRKAQEAIGAQGILPSVLNALSIVDKKKKYPFAYAEAVVSGDALTTVLARFETGMTASASENARIEAVAQKAKRDIRAAATAAQKRAAYAAVKWTAVVP